MLDNLIVELTLNSFYLERSYLKCNSFFCSPNLSQDAHVSFCNCSSRSHFTCLHFPSHRSWRWLVPAQKSQLLDVWEFCEPTVIYSHFQFHKLKISEIILKHNGLINIPNSSLPKYFTLFYYYLCSWIYLHLLHLCDRDSINGALLHMSSQLCFQ